MERIFSKQMNKLILKHLSDLYQIGKKREGIHLSSLVYCLTKSYWDLTSPLPPTEEEVMLFASGYGLQDILTPKEATIPLYEVDGIIYSPDLLIKVDDGQYVEIKTTRASLNTLLKDLPETWIEYIKGGCYIRNINVYHLAIFCLMGTWKPPFPILHCETLTFTDEELKENWNYILNRKEELEFSLRKRVPPEPFKWSKEWECRNCRYKLKCDVLENERR